MVPLDDDFVAGKVVDVRRLGRLEVACHVARDVERKFVGGFGGPLLKSLHPIGWAWQRAYVARANPTFDVAVWEPEVEKRERHQLAAGVFRAAVHPHERPSA